MTFQQLKYALCVAETGSFGEAARKLYLSQPSLSFAVRELEEELNLTIFYRSNRGVTVTKLGEEFLRNAKQILLQMELLEEKYSDKAPVQHHFSISTQHYTFASSAFVKLVDFYKDMEYELILNETKTLDVIEDVKTLRSEVGIIYLNKDNESIIRKILSDCQISFTELFVTYPYILVGEHNPIAKLSRVSVEELYDYPCISFVQNHLEPGFFSEEVIGIVGQKKSIRISDRAALTDLLGKSDAYIVSTGLYITSPKEAKKTVAIPLDIGGIESKIHVGLIRRKDVAPTDIGEKFCDFVKLAIKDYELDEHIKRYY